MTVALLPSAPLPNAARAGDVLEVLRAQLDGPLLTPDSADFNEARKVLYFTVDRHPQAIVRAANAQDVAAAVGFATVPSRWRSVAEATASRVTA